jgi:hypothetical protein
MRSRPLGSAWRCAPRRLGEAARLDNTGEQHQVIRFDIHTIVPLAE